VGDVEKSTSWGTGIEQQNIGFVAYTIADYTNRIEQRVTREVVTTRGHCAEFNLDKLMRGAMSERFLAYAQALNAGWISADEIRGKENMNPLGGKWAKPFPPAGLTQPMDGTPPGANQPQPQDDGDN
jgi:phage portal protein BeeE